MASKGDVKFTITGDDSDLQRTIKRANSGMDGLARSAKALTGVFAAVGGAMALKQLAEIADKYTLLEGRLKLVTSSTQELTRVQDELFKASQRTRSSYEATATLYTGLARSTKELGMSQSQLVGITESINQAMIVSGASQEEAANAMRQMQQALQGGVVRAEEYNSIMEQTPRVLQAVADGLGVTMGELRKQMLDGQLTAERFLEGFEKGAAGIKSEFDQLPATIGQALTALSNSWQQIIADSNSASGATRGIADAILDVSKAIDENREGITSLFVYVIDLAGKAAGGLCKKGSADADMRKEHDNSVGIITWLFGDDKKVDAILDDTNSQLEGLKNSFDTYVAGLKKTETQTTKTAEKTKTLADYTKQATEAIRKFGGSSGGDVWLSFDRGMTAANKSAEEYLQTLSDIDALVTDDAFFEIAGTFEAEMEEATDTSKALWQSFANDTSSIIENFVGSTLKGEFDSIEDMWSSLLDSMLDMFISFIAKAAAQDLINLIFDGKAGGGALSLTSLFSSDSSSSGGSGGGLGSLASSGSTIYKGYQWLTGGAKTAAAGSSSSVAGGTAATAGAGMSAYTYGSGAGAMGYTGAGGYVGGSVAEGGSLAAGSSGVGGSAAGGGMAAGIATAASYTGYAALAAIYLRALTYGDKPGVHDRLNEQLAGNGMSGAGLVGMYSGGLNPISDQVQKTLPALREFDTAMGDMNSGVLTLIKSAEESGTAMNVHAMAINSNTGLFQTLGGVMDTLEQNLANVGAETGTLTTAYIEQMSATYGLGSSTAALVEKFLGAGAAAEYLSEGANQVQQSVNAVSVAFTRFASSATAAGDRLSRAGGLLAHRGATFSLPQYAVGTDYVPRTGPAIVHKGEAIIPAEQNNGSRGVPDRAISINIGGKQMSELILSVVDGHITAREKRGVSGQRTAY